MGIPITSDLEQSAPAPISADPSQANPPATEAASGLTEDSGVVISSSPDDVGSLVNPTGQPAAPALLSSAPATLELSPESNPTVAPEAAPAQPPSVSPALAN